MLPYCMPTVQGVKGLVIATIILIVGTISCETESEI